MLAKRADFFRTGSQYELNVGPPLKALILVGLIISTQSAGDAVAQEVRAPPPSDAFSNAPVLNTLPAPSAGRDAADGSEAGLAGAQRTPDFFVPADNGLLFNAPNQTDTQNVQDNTNSSTDEQQAQQDAALGLPAPLAFTALDESVLESPLGDLQLIRAMDTDETPDSDADDFSGFVSRSGKHRSPDVDLEFSSQIDSADAFSSLVDLAELQRALTTGAGGVRLDLVTPTLGLDYSARAEQLVEPLYARGSQDKRGEPSKAHTADEDTPRSLSEFLQILWAKLRDTQNPLTILLGIGVPLFAFYFVRKLP